MKLPPRLRYAYVVAVLTVLLLAAGRTNASPPGGGLDRVNHIIVLTQENHSFDNYLGTLPWSRDTHYHPPAKAGGPCDPSDHQCVDGLDCRVGKDRKLSCSNDNPLDGHSVTVSHQTSYCTCNPEHEWIQAHLEANFSDPNSPLNLGNGFARANAPNKTATAMSYYTDADLPYYYALAETFAVSDRHFSSVVGPTLPNRMYLMAATSFGHVLTNKVDNTPPVKSGYRPITPTIFDRLDSNNVKWVEYYEIGEIGQARLTPPRPYGQLFRDPSIPNFQPLDKFFAAAKAGTLAQVVFIDLNEHEHPPLDVRVGQHQVARVVEALRNSPNWNDSTLLLTYDENGGFYDHVHPPAAPSPDGIPPGKCADKNAPPLSQTPGNGANCQRSAQAQEQLCAKASKDERCADFTQMGFRVPLIAISPFARPHYVSHVTTDHTSILALIEKRFLDGEHLTARDGGANTPEDMFDFTSMTPPSLKANVPATLAPEPVDLKCRLPWVVLDRLTCG